MFSVTFVSVLSDTLSQTRTMTTDEGGKEPEWLTEFKMKEPEKMNKWNDTYDDLMMRQSGTMGEEDAERLARFIEEGGQASEGEENVPSSCWGWRCWGELRMWGVFLACCPFWTYWMFLTSFSAELQISAIRRTSSRLSS